MCPCKSLKTQLFFKTKDRMNLALRELDKVMKKHFRNHFFYLLARWHSVQILSCVRVNFRGSGAKKCCLLYL